MLTALQQRLAAMIAELPESEGFALAGAAALLVHGLIDRPTLDLDFFASPAKEARVQELAAAIEQAVATADMRSVRRRDLRSFVRLEVSDGDQRCEIDLAVDYRALGVQDSQYGPTLAPEELAANKVLAVFDRAEPRDFRDLAAVTQRFSLGRCANSPARRTSASTSSTYSKPSFGRLTQEDLAVDEDEYRHLARLVERWIALVERMHERNRGMRGDNSGLER